MKKRRLSSSICNKYGPEKIADGLLQLYQLDKFLIPAAAVNRYIPFLGSMTVGVITHYSDISALNAIRRRIFWYLKNGGSWPHIPRVVTVDDKTQGITFNSLPSTFPTSGKDYVFKDLPTKIQMLITEKALRHFVDKGQARIWHFQIPVGSTTPSTGYLDMKELIHGYQ